jgi:hypothetical protein
MESLGGILDEATRKLPTEAPSSADGSHDGESDAERALRVAKEEGARLDALVAQLEGEPNTLPLTFCRVCQVEVKPVGKGKCPRCQTFLRLNFVARKHPVNVARRDALFAELVAEHQPRTVGTRATCEHLAATLERLETTKPGSTEWQRLITTAQTLGAALEEARKAALTTAPDAINEVRRVIIPSDGTLSSPGPQTLGEAEAATPAAPKTCPYCRQTLDRCAELKDTRLDAWRALHYSDPEEVKRRNPGPTYSLKELYESNAGLIRPDAPFTRGASTKTDPNDEMLEALRRQHKGGDPNVR